MRLIRQQPGFTLVEVVIVLALTSLMIAAFVATQGGFNRSTGFTSALDQLKSQLAGIQSDTVSAVQDNTRSNAGSSDLVVFGKVVEFDPAQPTTMHLYTLIGSDENVQNYGLVSCDNGTEPLKNGMRYTGGSKQAIIFRRQPNQIYTAPAGYNFTTQPPGLGTLDPVQACAGVRLATTEPTTPAPPPPVGGGGSPPPPPAASCPYGIGTPPSCSDWKPGLLALDYNIYSSWGGFKAFIMPSVNAADLRTKAGGSADGSELMVWYGMVNLGSYPGDMCIESSSGLVAYVNDNATPTAQAVPDIDDLKLNVNASKDPVTRCFSVNHSKGWVSMEIIGYLPPTNFVLKAYMKDSGGNLHELGPGNYRYSPSDPLVTAYHPLSSAQSPHKPSWRQMVVAQARNALESLGVVGRALAAGSNLILDPNNYTLDSGSTFTGTLNLPFNFDDGNDSGSIRVNPRANSIQRTVN